MTRPRIDPATHYALAQLADRLDDAPRAATARAHESADASGLTGPQRSTFIEVYVGADLTATCTMAAASIRHLLGAGS